jgi:hypothetical protein
MKCVDLGALYLSFIRYRIIVTSVSVLLSINGFISTENINSLLLSMQLIVLAMKKKAWISSDVISL